MATADILSQIIEVSPIPAFVIDRHHKVIYWNAAMQTLSGIRAEAVIGTEEQWRAFYPEKRPVMADIIMDGAPADLLETYYKGKKSRIIRGAYLFEDFFPSLGKGGKWFHFTVNNIKDSGKNIVGVIETLEDITERKKAEKKLRESEKSYKTLFESALDAIIVHDSRGRIKMVNAAAAELTGYKMEDLRGMRVSLLFPEQSFKSTNAGRPEELKLTTEDGNELICLVTTNAIVRAGRPNLFQSIARDITEEKRVHDNMRYYLKEVTMAQEEERKRIARELHDDTLQTLNFLTREMDNYILKAKDLTGQDVTALKNIEQDLVQAAKNIQKFSQDLRLSILDDLGLIAALRTLVKRMDDEGIKTEIAITGKQRRLPPETESLLFRIVQESINNIRKHARATRAWLLVDLSDGKLKITVKDNGCGFNFHGYADEMRRNGKLGLAGIEERGRLLGGSLTIDSRLNQGTTLTIETSITEPSA